MEGAIWRHHLQSVSPYWHVPRLVSKVFHNGCKALKGSDRSIYPASQRSSHLQVKHAPLVLKMLQKSNPLCSFPISPSFFFLFFSKLSSSFIYHVNALSLVFLNNCKYL
ncbi:unnamed protein product [Sphagnum troendelagicum]